MKNIIKRFLSDCRDLWTLLTRGRPKNDPLLLTRMVAEAAKIGLPSMADIDRWEADMFAKTGAWWFDPKRYDGTEFAWKKEAAPVPLMHCAIAQQAVYAQQVMQSRMNNLQFAGLYSNAYSSNRSASTGLLVGLELGGIFRL